MAPLATTVVQTTTAAKPQVVTRAKGKAGKAAKVPWNPTDLTWSERYSDRFAKFWEKCPAPLRKAVATMAVFALGLAMSGDIVVIFVHLRRQLGYSEIPVHSADSTPFTWGSISKYFENIGTFWVIANLVSYGMYFGIGGFLHWFFYVSRRSSAAEWKCQPDTWLPTELELHEIKIGSLSLLCTGSFSAFLACYISNGGWSTVYYNWSDYGLLWSILQWPAIFLYQDYVTYLLHRLYHTPWLYKNFHKLHHTYKQPTAFSVTAIHPVEVMHIQMTLCVPLFAFPVHWVSFYIIALYTYYHGIIDHSGINFKAYWWQPWQPDAIFHDNHHQYFHVNFGFNCWFWDKLHGTYRRKDRLYTEDIFYGRGKALTEATAEEIATDLQERLAENPKAYRNDTLEFALSEKEMAALKKAK